MTHYMLDTNTVSYILKNKSAALASRLQRIGRDEVLCLSAVTEGELRFGFAKNPAAKAGKKHLEQLLPLLDILPWTSAEAAVYGELRARQVAVGKTLSPLDMLIAAHAVAVGAILVTNDRAFQQVHRLKVENWASDL